MTGDSSRSTSSPAALRTPSPKVPRRRHPSLRWATSTNRSCYRIWGIFGAFLTVAELAIGIGLVFGIATRLAAVGGLLLIGPIWVMLLHTNLYLWQYPAEDLFPLLLLAIVPAGRLGGLDGRLSRRFGYRWPF